MDIKAFRNPPKSVRPLVRWWWPGLDVNEEELRREVADLDASGCGGAELQPFMIGLSTKMEKTDPEKLARCHRFMHDFHYEMMAAVIDEAKKRNMFIDITGNSAWPAGGNHIPDDISLQTLFFGTSKISGGKKYKGKVPGFKKPKQYFFMSKLVKLLVGFPIMDYVGDDKKVIKVIAAKQVGNQGKKKFTSWKVKKSTVIDAKSLIDITDKVSGSTIEWDAPEGDWRIFAVYAGSAGARPVSSATSDANKIPNVVDHFDKEAVTFHFESFIGKAKDWFGDEFGKTFRAVFTDSFEILSPMFWTGKFLEEFKSRRGYDVEKYLPICYVPLKDNGYYTYGNEVGIPNFDLEGGDGQRIRYDFQRTLSELFIESYIKNAAQWCGERGLKSRVQGYGMLVDPLSMLGYSQIPETEQIYNGGSLNFLKVAGAAGTLYSRPVVTCESINWPDRVYLTTPLKWRIALDRMYESGVNQPVYHSFPYRDYSFPYPGFNPFASPYMTFSTFASDMSRDNKLLFDAAPKINGYAARMQQLLQNSITKTSVAVFYQLFDYPNGTYLRETGVLGYLDEYDVPLGKANVVLEFTMPSKADGKKERTWIKDTAELGYDLVANGYYYMYLNEDRLIEASEVKDDKLIIGEAEFEAIILYREQKLPLAVARKLKEISEQGIKVIIFGQTPKEVPDYLDYENQEKELNECFENIGGKVYESHEEIIGALDEGGVTKEVVFEKAEYDIGFIHKKDRGSDTQYYFFRNDKRVEKVLDVVLPVKNKVPAVVDAWNGEVYRMPDYSASEDGIEMTLKLGEYSSVMIALMDEAEAKDLKTAPLTVLKSETDTELTLESFALSAEKREIDGSFTHVSAQITKPVDLRQVAGFEGVSSPCVYTTSFDMQSVAEGKRYFLDIEHVSAKADVELNGQKLGELLCMPWRMEITSAIKEGTNELKITVTPTLINRLVGYSAKSKQHKFFKGKQNMSSGLIGSVEITSV